MTWWTDWLSFLGNIVQSTADWWSQYYYGEPSGILDIIGAVITVPITIFTSFAPFFPIIIVFYIIDVIKTSAEIGSFQPIGQLVFRILDILVGVAEALASAINALIPL